MLLGPAWSAWSLNGLRSSAGRALTEGSFAALGIDTQMDFRLPLLAGAVLGAEVIILSTTMVAVRRRRLSEGKFFELTLGAPVTYTKWPALAEGLGQGLAGGVVAVVLVVVAAPIITGGERTTAQVITAYTTFQVRGGPSSATTRVARLASLHLSLGDLSVIALVVAGLGALLGLLNASISLRPPRHHGHDDPGD